MLTQPEIDTYERDGLVVPADFRIPPAQLERLRAAVNGILERNPGIPPERLINPHLDAEPPLGVRGSEALFELARDPRILELVAQLIGEDLILWSTHLFCKPAGLGREVPWHQDGHYWPIRPLATCTAWVALDDVAVDNGAMRVMPGSHRRGDYRHYTDPSPRLALDQVLEPDQIDESRAFHVELSAGQMSLHDVHLVHGSAANTSGRRRAGLALRYMPSTSHFRRDLVRAESRLDWKAMPIYLVQGVNRHEDNDYRQA